MDLMNGKFSLGSRQGQKILLSRQHPHWSRRPPIVPFSGFQGLSPASEEWTDNLAYLHLVSTLGMTGSILPPPNTSSFRAQGRVYLHLGPLKHFPPSHGQISAVGLYTLHLRHFSFCPKYATSPIPYKNKLKVRPRTGHERPEGEWRYSSSISLTSALDGGGWLTSRPGRFTIGRETRYLLYSRLGGP